MLFLALYLMSLTRRQFILSATGSVVAAAGIASTISAASEQPSLAPQDFPTLLRRSTDITPTEQFFYQKIRTVPSIQRDTWTLWVGGLVENPLVLNYQELQTLPLSNMVCTVACVGNPAGGNWMGNGLWRGTSIHNVLEQATATPEARYVHFLSADDYATSLPLDRVSDAILAFELNGHTLTPEHGFPVRLIVPGLYGYKMPKWLQKIELSDAPLAGFWEGRGWSADGEVQTTSAIFSPRPAEAVSGIVTISGIAYAGTRRITQVEVSIDSGSWMPVPFAASTPPRWTSWQIDWTPPAPGEYLVKVRATDSDGFTQNQDASAKPFPNGARGLHSIVVRVIG